MARARARPPGSASSSNAEQPPTRREAAEYIASILESLRLVAHQGQLPFLSYLISVALEEARNQKSSRQ